MLNKSSIHFPSFSDRLIWSHTTPHDRKLEQPSIQTTSYSQRCATSGFYQYSQRSSTAADWAWADCIATTEVGAKRIVTGTDIRSRFTRITCARTRVLAEGRDKLSTCASWGDLVGLESHYTSSTRVVVNIYGWRWATAVRTLPCNVSLCWSKEGEEVEASLKARILRHDQEGVSGSP